MADPESNKHVYTNRHGQTAEERAAYEQAGPDLTQLRVATADQDQYPLLGELTIRAYEPVLPDLYTSGYAKLLADVAGRAAGSTILVALFGEFVIGGVTLIVGRQDSGDTAAVAGLDFLAVDPSAQSLGAGRMLVETCLERAKAEGCREVLAHLNESMTAAAGLLQSVGFVADPTGDLVGSTDPGWSLHRLAIDPSSR